jgi:hypothetical protein
MHDPLLVQFTAEAVAELNGNADLVLSKAPTSRRLSTWEPIRSSNSSATQDSSPPPTYEDVKADDSYEEDITRDPEKKSASELHCDQNCRCVCHTNQKILPDDLSMKRQTPSSCLIARFVRACTLRECKKKRRRSIGSVTVPSQVLNMALGIKLLSRGFNHLFFLKTYNSVSENSDQIRYATSGNLQGLMMLVQTNKATINDTGPDGWTLLHVRTALLISGVCSHQ